MTDGPGMARSGPAGTFDDHGASDIDGGGFTCGCFAGGEKHSERAAPRQPAEGHFATAPLADPSEDPLADRPGRRQRPRLPVRRARSCPPDVSATGGGGHDGRIRRFAGVPGATNAITYTTDLLGDVTLIGPGAGGVATGFALLSDILAAHRSRGR